MSDTWLRRRAGRGTLLAAVALGEASGILLILQTGLLVRIGNGVMFARDGMPALAPFFAAFLAVVAARAAVTWGSRRAAFECASGVKRALRAELAAHLRDLGPVPLSAMHAGEIANTVVDGVEALEPYYAKYLPQRAIATLLPFTILAVVFPLDWLSGLVLVLTAVFLPLSMIVIGEESHARYRRVWARLADMSGRFLDALQGLPTLRMFAAARREAAEIARSSDEYRRTAMSALRIAFVSSFMLELISTVSIAIVAVACGLRLLAGSMRFAPGYFVLLAAPEYFLTLRSLGTFYHSRMEAASAAEHIRKLLEAGGAAPRPAPAAVPAGRRTPQGAPRVVFDRVSFATPRGTVLDGAAFAVEAGEHVAVCGPSGAGKSTIFGLLLGFVSPQDGAVVIDGLPLAALDRVRWLERVAWLPQAPTLFHGTLRENIRIGRVAASDREVEEAARLAGVDELAALLPAGLETRVGEGGQGLSAGQVQRVALARLFLRSPDLVLLDEPTAHLDADSARLVGSGIRMLSEGRTVIVATHRPATAEAADRVLLLDGGRVREAT